MPHATNSKIQQLWKRFRKRPFREAFASQHLSDNIAAQIVAMRAARDWTQTKLAQEAGMAQARISVLEDPDYDMTSLTTLKRLAKAFDVALVVRFVAYSELLNWASNVTPDKLAPPEFDKDTMRDGLALDDAPFWMRFSADEADNFELEENVDPTEPSAFKVRTSEEPWRTTIPA